MNRLLGKPLGSNLFGSINKQSGGGKVLRSTFLAASLLMLCHTAAASAQNGERRDSVGEDALDAATQPLTDLNLRSRDIPAILLIAQEAPYDLADVPDCAALYSEVSRLDEVLGPDADEPADKEGLINRGLRFGGDTLGDFIPFRSVVRRISGARAHEKRWERAIYGGVARRSYLKGVAAGRHCEVEIEPAPPSAQQVLGLDR